MEEKTVKKINAATFATMLGAISGMVGFIAGLIMAVLSSEIISFDSQSYRENGHS